MPTNEPRDPAMPTDEQLDAGAWRQDDEESAELDEELGDELEGARLRVSRDATAADLALFMPDTDAADREAWLAKLREQECEVTFSVVTTVPGGELAGMIMGPPGSARAPISRRVDSAAADAEGAGAEVVDAVDRRRFAGEHVNCEHDPAGSDVAKAMICSPMDAEPFESPLADVRRVAHLPEGTE
jgi:hypothetical protein